jgi:hypothetical protein
LRQVFIRWTDGWQAPQAGFYYAPEPVGGAPATMVYRDEFGQWQIAQDKRTTASDDISPLTLADLRLSPETVAEAFQAAEPGISVQGVGLMREDCELVWHLGGFILDGEGRVHEVVEGNVMDASGDFQVTNRYDFPTTR